MGGGGAAVQFYFPSWASYFFFFFFSFFFFHSQNKGEGGRAPALDPPLWLTQSAALWIKNDGDDLNGFFLF